MILFRTSAIIFLFFFLGFGIAQYLKQRTLGAADESTHQDSCKCIDDCYATMMDEALRICGWENRTCFCSALLKGIHCMEPCPDCPRKYDLVQGLKKYYEKMLQCGPIVL
ncbi:hypothetical protein Ddc_14785 [Ditylenchus destructor]|nr:hypothetical protein Ddc_14785 [Ditylenchus destructor]